MLLFDIGDEVAVYIWDRDNQRFYHETGTVVQHGDISHYIVKFNSDGKLYQCHTSKVISIKAIPEVEFVNEKEKE